MEHQPITLQRTKLTNVYTVYTMNTEKMQLALHVYVCPIPCDSTERSLDNESRNFVFSVSCFRVNNWCLSKHSEYLSYATITDPGGGRERRREMKKG